MSKDLDMEAMVEASLALEYRKLKLEELNPGKPQIDKICRCRMISVITFLATTGQVTQSLV